MPRFVDGALPGPEPDLRQVGGQLDGQVEMLPMMPAVCSARTAVLALMAVIPAPATDLAATAAWWRPRSVNGTSGNAPAWWVLTLTDWA
ncbi:MAG: hypothetical protein M3Y26_05840 [Actinomycetota bacterium]|nr:hypothetical protein [Actinomycetota bacterium]